MMMTVMVMVVYTSLLLNAQHCLAATGDTRRYHRSPDVQTGMEVRIATAPGARNGSLFARSLIPSVAGGPLAWPSSFLCLHAFSHPSAWPASWAASGGLPATFAAGQDTCRPFPRPCDHYIFRGKCFFPVRMFSGSCLYHRYSELLPWWCFYSFLVLDSWCPFFTSKFCPLALENYFVISFENVFPSIFFVLPPPIPDTLLSMYQNCLFSDAPAFKHLPLTLQSLAPAFSSDQPLLWFPAPVYLLQMVLCHGLPPVLLTLRQMHFSLLFNYHFSGITDGEMANTCGQ